MAVGRCNGAWGLRGHVKVTLLTTNPDRFAPGALLLVRGRPRRVLELRSQSGVPCVQFEGCFDRTAAEALRGALIEIDEADLPPLPPGEHYIHDLVGLDVVTTAGAAVGRLHEVLRTGANDVYVVHAAEGREVLVPAVSEVVIAVDLESRRIVIEPLAGMLDR
ncbi:MAG: 16S rRNA processing protein RimM [Dehalococcoidia bacterium]|nr:16S rRNA processing protein RimM [Dehalococcoidia bacterium]